MMKIKIFSILYAFVYLTLCFSTTTNAEMLISPTRVMVDEEIRSTTMTLRNTSGGPRTYRLSWEDKRATETGSYTAVADDEDWPSAKELIRFSPRQITVGPGENQTVRFSFRPPSDLPFGEYRSHLLLKVIPDISEPTSTLGGSGLGENVGVQVAMQMSFSIPIVARYNTDLPTVSIDDVKAVPLTSGDGIRLAVTFNREGIASSYGNVKVEMQRDSNSEVELIGKYDQLSIFSEINQRTVFIALRDKSIPGGAVVRIGYEGAEEYKGTLWAERVFKTE
ncbi:MAG: molecular chaperone [Granulosicoccus sp.]